jgi:tRNA(Arg) A34 adenosine deaminase TadA
VIYLDNLRSNMDEIFMLAALAQSRKALPECLPNPPVGCAIVYGQEIVAQGYTQAPGKHHAEADALKQIQGKAFNLLKMYVISCQVEDLLFRGQFLLGAISWGKETFGIFAQIR